MLKKYEPSRKINQTWNKPIFERMPYLNNKNNIKPKPMVLFKDWTLRYINIKKYQIVTAYNLSSLYHKIIIILSKNTNPILQKKNSQTKIKLKQHFKYKSLHHH